MSRQVFRARQLAPMNGPVIDDGCVIVDGGKLVALGEWSRLSPARADHEIDGVLMPGLLNRHTHLELTNIPRSAAPTSFQDWLFELGPQVRGDEATFAERRIDAVRQGIAQCIKFGVTTVWDITQNPDIVRPVLAQAPIRTLSFGEALGIGTRRQRFGTLLVSALDDTYANDRLSIGISPHAPYTVDETGMQSVLFAMDRTGLPAQMHVAESPDESRFLLDHGGAFGALYAQFGRTDLGEPCRFAGTPIEWLVAITGGTRLHLAHVNYLDESDYALLPRIAASVTWCPRTHAYFGHPEHPWRRILATPDAPPVYVATDSCASSPDLNIVDDLRLIHSQSPEQPVGTIWSLCTLPLVPGNPADFVVFPTRSSDPLREILQTPGLLPAGVFVDGKSVTS